MATINETEIMERIGEDAWKVLQTKGIELPKDHAPRIIKDIMAAGLEQLIVNTKRLANENGGEANVLFSNLLEVSITNRESDEGDKDGNLMVAFTPGPQAKLLAKSDDATEGEDD